jgi:TMEM175 potassium channel family protein
MSEPTRSAAPFDLTTERLEAFSDAVIAVIITILALGLELPSSTSWLAIREQVGSFLIYILAFVNLAIWWNNHHHLLRATTRINGAVMWANMALLFFLSLIPVATQWLRTAHQPKPAAFFGLVSFCAGIAYSVLIRTIIRANGPDSVVARSVHGDVKGLISIALFGAGVVVAVLSAWISIGTLNLGTWIPIALYVAVAVMWLVPDRRFTHDHPDEAAA